MRIRRAYWNPHLTVFLSSACVMVLELVASRLVAPRLGVSLYTWTSIIGVILAGMSLGNFIGGRLADRFASPTFLGLIFVLASLFSLSILWLVRALGELAWSQHLPLLLWVVTDIAIVFFLPSVVLGCVSPIVVKLTLQDLTRTGTTVGKIYAWSSAGSILGTFATGFFLISWLGTKSVVLLVGGILLLMGLWFLTMVRWQKAVASAAVAVILFGGATWTFQAQGVLKSDCLVESDYFCIKVHDTEMGSRKVRELILDRLVHSYTDLDDPMFLGYGYERTYAGVLEPLLEQKPDMDAFFIGGGAYTFPRYLEILLPESHLVVTEIDPAVTETARQELGLPRDSRIEIHDMDSRLFMTWQSAPDSYDLIFGDAFNDYSVPYHLTTLEFDQMIDSLLRDDGMYLANIIDGGQRGHFMRAFVRTLQQVFTYVEVIPTIEGWRDAARTTFVIAASQVPIDLSQLGSFYKPLSKEELDEYLQMEPPLILTDDYVPVDNLLAPVFDDSHRG
ncbi:MAG: fused MFS/spermidine synthase [Chloroflexi bacterium]|jgi:spermidine synthase|nr:fused MFS/spermidine synthase [Chloroflexota bacterium]